jgi:hypothetical protein
MSYTPEDKYQLECQKLEQDIHNMRRSFIRQPGTWLALLPLLISVGFNLQQCNSREQEKILADIKLARTEEDIRKDAAIRDSVREDVIALETKRSAILAELKGFDDSAKAAAARLYTLTSTSTDIPEPTRREIVKAQESFHFLANASQQAAVNIQRGSNAGFAITATPDEMQAAQKEKEGFIMLMKGDYNGAATAFTQSENAKNGYHNSYELARLLRKNAAAMSKDEQVRQEILQAIAKGYATYAPAEVKDWLRGQLK